MAGKIVSEELKTHLLNLKKTFIVAEERVISYAFALEKILLECGLLCFLNSIYLNFVYTVHCQKKLTYKF